MARPRNNPLLAALMDRVEADIPNNKAGVNLDDLAFLCDDSRHRSGSVVLPVETVEELVWWVWRKVEQETYWANAYARTPSQRLMRPFRRWAFQWRWYRRTRRLRAQRSAA